MLHAELHGKIAHDVSNIARREDMLTSTVFGTLFTAGADATVRAWLAKARTPTGEPLVLPTDAAVDDYWFWPRLDATEPDVLIRVGSLLVIVEAKYRSPRSSDDPLEREWTACKQPASPVFRSDIRAAIDGCSARALVYVVQRSRVARELPYVARSITSVPGARMYLLTWEDLDEVLPPRGGPRWQRELRQYLRVREVTASRPSQRRCASPGHRPPTVSDPARTRRFCAKTSLGKASQLAGDADCGVRLRCLHVAEPQTHAVQGV